MKYRIIPATGVLMLSLVATIAIAAPQLEVPS
jgi:hypothetical protein